MPAEPATRRRPTTWSAACAPAFSSWRRCSPVSVLRAYPCREAARSARGRSTCISRRWTRSAPTSTSSPATSTRATKGDGLRGGRIVLSSPSVGATETALMAAILARGETEILNAARDPEVCDLALCLAAMGARIEGAGTHRILVQGVDALHHARHELITDRIEAGTYAIAAAITGGHLEILGAHLEHLGSVGAVAGKCRSSDLADRSRPDGCPLRPLAGHRRHDRTLPRISHGSAGAVHGADDHRIRRIGHPRDRVREPIHARARARAARRQHLAARLDGAGAWRRAAARRGSDGDRSCAHR